MSAAAVGLLALVIADPAPCLLRDPSVLAPPPVLGAFGDARASAVCPPDRVRASELPLHVPPPGSRKRETAPGPFTCEDDGCWAWAGVGERRAMVGAAAVLDVWNPAVGPGEHSLAELALRGGPDLREVLEIGWTVSPRLHPDGRPILLVQRWSAGRLRDGTGGLHPWSSAFAPGMDLSAWIGRSIRVGWLHREGRWWAWFEGGWLGWYDDDDFADPFPVAGAAQWFGEVFFGGLRPTLAMGNGRHATDAGAARFGGLCTMGPGDTRCTAPRTLWPRVTDRAAYGLVVEGTDGFRYGGPGEPVARPRPPPSSASEGTPSARGTSAPSPPR